MTRILAGNRTVWKFGPIGPGGNSLKMPRGAQLLSVAFQEDNLYVWAAVNPVEEKVVRRVGVLPTGLDSLPQDGHEFMFIGTAHNRHGTVWHVFEAVPLHPGAPG